MLSGLGELPSDVCVIHDIARSIPHTSLSWFDGTFINAKLKGIFQDTLYEDKLYINADLDSIKCTLQWLMLPTSKHCVNPEAELLKCLNQRLPYRKHLNALVAKHFLGIEKEATVTPVKQASTPSYAS